MRPLVSIITVTFNACNTIARCIESVAHQSYDKIEHIIIDGGSNDGTVDIIKRYDRFITRLISERDDGIFCAMNKGFDLSNGKIIAFLNADDYYESGAVKRLVELIISKDLAFSYSSIRLLKKDMPDVILQTKCKNLVDALKLQEMPFPHPTLFVCRNAFLKVGKFDTRYRYSADYEFALKLLKANLPGEGLDEVLANYQIGGASSCQKAIYECFIIAIRHGKNPISGIIVFLYRSIKRQMSVIIPKIVKMVFNNMIKQF